MRHHEYQIYYGGFKKVLQQAKYCKDCHTIIIPDNSIIRKIAKSKKQHIKLQQSNNVSIKSAKVTPLLAKRYTGSTEKAR